MASLFNKNPPMINSIFSPKNFLISITSALVALMLKLYAPALLELLLSGVPMIWTTLGSWFRPPYLYVIVNFIIIAIAASSRFQQQNNTTTTTTTDDGNKVREVVAPIKAQAQEYPYSFDVVTKNNSGEHMVELEVKTVVKKPKALEVKARKNLVAENIDQMKAAAAGVSSKSRLLVGLEAKDINQVKTKKKPPSVVPKPTESVYTETKKKVMESLQEFEVRRQKNKKDGDMEERWLQVRNKMESSAKEGEDHHARSKSVGMSIPMNSTQNNPSPYFFSQEKGLSSDTCDYQEDHHNILQAGKDESSTEAEGEENDTLEGTWKMIMERSRNQNAVPQEASLGFEKFKESNSPSQSTRMQDTSNW